MLPAPSTFARLDVLVVDDIDQSRLELTELVERLGHGVVAAAGGEEALQCVRSRLPDLVLLDLLMPDLDGFEVTRRIRQIAPTTWVPVLVTSSLQGDDHFCAALAQGADDYLTRPVNVQLLDAKLRHYARVLRLQRDVAVAMQRQRDIHDNISDAVLTLDDEGTIIDANMAACRRFGATWPSELAGCGCRDVTGLELAALTAGGAVTLTAADGRSFPAEIGSSQWHDAGASRVTLVLRDLSERRAIERLKAEFLATVSHELRTPLTSIVGSVSLVVAGKAGVLPPQAAPLLGMAHRNAQRLSRLIDDLLDLTKLEGDRMTLRLQRVDAASLVAEALDANHAYAQRAGVRLAAHGQDTSAAVSVDPDRFLQVMSNLISNAVKHSPAQGEVTVALSSTSHWVHYSVGDEGPGIPADFQHRMFEKFSQADGSDQRAKGGTGLGLYVARLLVERMGGQITAGAREGGGSEFRIRLPRADAPAAPERPVLWIVDRDVDASASLRALLGARWRVSAVVDLAQAADLGRPDPTTVLLADPQGQGMAVEFCDGLRRLARGRPVLLYSDAVDAAFVQRQGLHWMPKSGEGTGAEMLERKLADLGRPKAGQEG
ncbi:MAG: response regulator [Rhodoferax sp.]|nr:response regulator [Rhodoferax sp.]